MRRRRNSRWRITHKTGRYRCESAGTARLADVWSRGRRGLRCKAGGQSRAATSVCLRSRHLRRGRFFGSRMIPPPLRCAGRRSGRSATTATQDNHFKRPAQLNFPDCLKQPSATRISRRERNLVLFHISSFHANHVLVLRRIEVVRQFLRGPRIPNHSGMRVEFFNADRALQFLIVDFNRTGVVRINTVGFLSDVERRIIGVSPRAIGVKGKIVERLAPAEPVRLTAAISPT